MLYRETLNPGYQPKLTPVQKAEIEARKEAKGDATIYYHLLNIKLEGLKK